MQGREREKKKGNEKRRRERIGVADFGSHGSLSTLSLLPGVKCQNPIERSVCTFMCRTANESNDRGNDSYSLKRLSM